MPTREELQQLIDNERATTESIVTNDRGPDEVIAYPNQSVFVVPPAKSGPVKFPMGLSGSLTRLVDGTPYLIAGNNVTITTGSKGQITIGAEGRIGGVGGSSSGGGTVATSVEWKTYTPTVGVVSGTPPAIDAEPHCYLRGRYVVQGKMMTLVFSMSGVGIGSPNGNGTYRISLPPGFTIDTNLITLGTIANQYLDGTAVATASLVMNTAASSGGWAVVPNSTSTLVLIGQFFGGSSSGSPISWSSSNFPFNNVGSTYRISFVANIPLL